MTRMADTTGTTRFKFAKIICIASSLGISRAGAIVPEKKASDIISGTIALNKKIQKVKWLMFVNRKKNRKNVNFPITTNSLKFL